MASIICQALGRGVTRSKRRAQQWTRKAAENGHTNACLVLAAHMYGDQPYAREVGHVEEAAGVASPAAIVEGHDVPLDVLTGVVMSTGSVPYVAWRWRGTRIATTRGARLWAS